MSDYEGEWEPIVQRGNAFAPAKPQSIRPDPAHGYIVPRVYSAEQAEQAKTENRKSRKSSAITLPADYRKPLQIFNPAVSLGNQSFRDARAQKPLGDIQKTAQGLPAYEKYKNNFENPDANLQFGRSIKNLKAALPTQNGLLPAQVFRDRLATISVDTHTCIVVSETNEYACNIWGDADNIRRAKDQLHAFELHLINPGKGQKASKTWAKQPAFDGRDQNRLMTHQWKNLQDKYFQEHTDDTTLAYQAHLYWPDGYDLEKFIDYYWDDVLQDLMVKYTCIIRQNPVDRLIKVACDTQQDLFLVHNRLMGLNREMVAKQHPGLYATHCEVPDFASYKDRVELIKVETSAGLVNIPSLTGTPLPKTEHEHWTQLSSNINKRYRLAAKNSLRSCINSLYLSQKHLQLRIIFGSFGLLQVRKAPNGSGTYSIDEFVDIIQKAGTKVAQRPLVEGRSCTFIDNIESSPEFELLNISWEVWFEFSSGTSKKLQLVQEYIPNTIDPDEPSVAATRWLTHDDNSIDEHSDILSVNHIDMKRCGYQLHLGGSTIFESHTTSQANLAFEKTVRFRPSMNGIRHDANKHVIHPHGNQELTLIREVTIAKYRFKDTQGTFEVRRTDTFNAKPGQSSPVAKQTDWSATYYYAGWDRLLSDLANIEPGENVKWNRDLHTFFPRVWDDNNPQALPIGFNTFMKEVDELQTSITKALRENNKTNSTNDNRTNGATNGGTK